MAKTIVRTEMNESYVRKVQKRSSGMAVPAVGKR